MADDECVELKNYIILKDSKGNSAERCNSSGQIREIPVSDAFKWTGEQTYFLLEQYEMQIGNVGPLKPFRKKKNMWKYICEQCSEEFGKELTIDQVEGRFKTIIKAAKIRIQQNGTSGSLRKNIPYSGILDKIIYRNMPNISRGSRPPDDAHIKQKGKRLHEDMIDRIIADRKERHKEKLEAKARRHKEQMNLLTKILTAKAKNQIK